jgi:hypothetical protein
MDCWERRRLDVVGLPAVDEDAAVAATTVSPGSPISRFSILLLALGSGVQSAPNSPRA